MFEQLFKYMVVQFYLFNSFIDDKKGCLEFGQRNIFAYLYSFFTLFVV